MQAGCGRERCACACQRRRAERRGNQATTCDERQAAPEKCGASTSYILQPDGRAIRGSPVAVCGPLPCRLRLVPLRGRFQGSLRARCAGRAVCPRKWPRPGEATFERHGLRSASLTLALCILGPSTAKKAWESGLLLSVRARVIGTRADRRQCTASAETRLGKTANASRWQPGPREDRA